jgi:molybdopterin molybdotransferase
VAIITTGNEVIPIDQPVSDVQIRNSNAWLLKALLAKHGIQPFSISHMPDERAQLQQAFKDAAAADIIISCGGVSAGDADFVPEAAQATGAKQLFHKVMIRPGKPVWCGKLANGKMIFALPGNPLSTMTTFTLFIQPFLNACYGLPSPLWFRMTLKEERAKKNTLDEFFPVKIIPGTSSVQTVPFNGSGDIRTAIFADGIALHPREKNVLKSGEQVDYISLLS